MAHIFVVDDDEQLLRMVGLMLERGGHTATLVSNPIESLEMMRDEPPDLAILDVMMPGMNGLELCRELRQDPATHHVPIIILTARGPIEDRNEALEIGADNYINKPVTSMELLNHVDHLLKNPPQRTAPPSQVSQVIEEADEDVPEIEPEYIDETSMSFAVYGFTGGCGRTTMAVNLVSQLQHQYPGEVCLVDLTSSGSQAAMHFRLQPRKTWEGLMASDSDLAVYELLIEHESGLRVLAAPIMPVLSTTLGLRLAQQIFEELTSEFRFVVFDLPSVATSATNYILENVDIGLHMIRPEVMSVQTAVRTMRWLSTKGPTINKNILVLNQTAVEAQLNQTIVKRGLGTEIDYAISHDSGQSKALVQGSPLSLKIGQEPTTPIQIAMAQMVDNLLAPIPAEA
ncbi:MAG: response regulator [Chloroflexota bacterium]